MLVPVSSFICPISQEPAKDPVYLRNCKHSFDRDNIVRWLQQQLDVANSAQCPLCREIYTLNLRPDKERERVIGKLFEKILLPLVVPQEINQIVESVNSRLPRDREATEEEIAKAAEELATPHLPNRAPAPENNPLSAREDGQGSLLYKLLAEHREELRARDKVLTDLVTAHNQQMNFLLKECIAEKKETALNTKSSLGQTAMSGFYAAFPLVAVQVALVNKVILYWRS